MWNSLRHFFEKMAYAGLKPRNSATKPAVKPKSGSALQGWIDSKLNQAGSSDPLYLSNRTFAQKMRAWAIFGIPAAAVLGVAALVLFRTPGLDAPPPAQSNAEIAAKMLPDLNQDLHIRTQRDLEIGDVHVVSGSPLQLSGVAKNNSDREIAAAELVFDLTDQTGSRQGAVTTEVKNIAAKSSVTFTFPIEQTNATFALVREVHVR
jgi:hypothetical protein